MDDLKNNLRKDPLAFVLVAGAALLLALGLGQLGLLAIPAPRPQIEVHKPTPPAEVQARVAADKSAAGNLKKKNLFIPPEKPRNPVTEVGGILGSEALINGKWYKAGAKVGEGPNVAVIVAVEPTKVRVKWNGKETEFLPIHASGQSSGARASEGGPRGAAGEGRRGGPPTVTRPEGTSTPPSGMRRGGLPAEEMNAYMEKMRNASSPEERQRIRDEMRQKMSGQ